MSNLDDVMRLKDEIIASFDDRMNTLADIARSSSDLRQSTRDMTDRHRSDRLRMKNDLQSHLNAFKKKIRDDDLQRINDARREFDERMQQLNDLLSGFKRNGESELTNSVRDMLDGFRSSRLGEFNSFIDKVQQRIYDLKDEVHQMLNDFNSSRHDISLELKRDLSEFNRQLQNFRSSLSGDEKARSQQARKEIADRISYLNEIFDDVNSMLSNLRSESRKVAEEWRKIAKLLEKKKAAPASDSAEPVSMEEPEPVKTVAKPDNEQSQAPEKSDPQQEILAMIEDYAAQGIKLTQIGKHLNTNWQSLIPFVKELIEKGKIEKKNSLYFPK